MMLWAIISGLTAITKDYTGTILCRFFLGLVEAPYYPGALYLRAFKRNPLRADLVTDDYRSQHLLHAQRDCHKVCEYVNHVKSIDG